MANNTLTNIHNALKKLLKTKKCDEIKITEIIKESKISRSTFYFHYKSVSDIIDAIVDEIFIHVTSSNLSKENKHDFSNTNVFSYKHIITHLFYHFIEEKDFIIKMKEQNNIIFKDKYLSCVYSLIENLYSFNLIRKNNLPPEIYIQQITYSLIGLLNFSLTCDKYQAEDYQKYFFELYGN